MVTITGDLDFLPTFERGKSMRQRAIDINTSLVSLVNVLDGMRLMQHDFWRNG